MVMTNDFYSCEISAKHISFLVSLLDFMIFYEFDFPIIKFYSFIKETAVIFKINSALLRNEL